MRKCVFLCDLADLTPEETDGEGSSVHHKWSCETKYSTEKKMLILLLEKHSVTYVRVSGQRSRCQ